MEVGNGSEAEMATVLDHSQYAKAGEIVAFWDHSRSGSDFTECQEKTINDHEQGEHAQDLFVCTT